MLAATCIALGHLHDPRAIPGLVALSEHPDHDVRYAVVHGLLGHDADAAVATLITLSSDAEAQVRDWATFGLGQQIERDVPAIHVALRERLTDPDCATRQKAFSSLARHDGVIVERHFLVSPTIEVQAAFFRPDCVGDDLWRCDYGLRWPD